MAYFLQFLLYLDSTMLLVSKQISNYIAYNIFQAMLTQPSDFVSVSIKVHEIYFRSTIKMSFYFFCRIFKIDITLSAYFEWSVSIYAPGTVLVYTTVIYSIYFDFI